MSPLFSTILQVTNTCLHHHAQHSTFIYFVPMPVEMQCSLGRTKHIPYSLYFRSLRYKEDSSYSNERKQRTCPGNSLANTVQLQKGAQVLTLNGQCPTLSPKQEAGKRGVLSSSPACIAMLEGMGVQALMGEGGDGVGMGVRCRNSAGGVGPQRWSCNSGSF